MVALQGPVQSSLVGAELDLATAAQANMPAAIRKLVAKGADINVPHLRSPISAPFKPHCLVPWGSFGPRRVRPYTYHIILCM